MTAPDVDICDVLDRAARDGYNMYKSDCARAPAELRQTRKQLDVEVAEVAYVQRENERLETDLAAAVELLQYVANGGRPSAKARAFLDALAKRGGT